jgi:hypothetical protein
VSIQQDRYVAFAADEEVAVFRAISVPTDRWGAIRIADEHHDLASTPITTCVIRVTLHWPSMSAPTTDNWCYYRSDGA